MHLLEPFYDWRGFYTAEADELSPFYGREYSEFHFHNKVYDHYLHPQWDEIGSPTLFIKILYADYDEGACVIELIGEWNDAIYNDIMTFKRDIIDHLIEQGIDKFILIGENIMNFHSSDDCYYEEWFDDIADGWIALVGFREHVVQEFESAQIDQYFLMGGRINQTDWRTYQPSQLIEKMKLIISKRLG
jgi:hypothetical protein